MVEKVEESRFTPNNCIFLKVSKAFPENPYAAYSMIIIVHETISA